MKFSDLLRKAGVPERKSTLPPRRGKAGHAKRAMQKVDVPFIPFRTIEVITEDPNAGTLIPLQKMVVNRNGNAVSFSRTPAKIDIVEKQLRAERRVRTSR